MHCPFCHKYETKVIDSRLVGDDGSQVRRRRECLECTERFTTYEIVELSLPRVVKRDGTREAFNEEKLRKGVLRSLEKRPVSADQVEELMDKVKLKLKTYGEREVPTSLLGDWVVQELKSLDQVAYIRFASVYRKFQDIKAFVAEIQKLEELEHK